MCDTVQAFWGTGGGNVPIVVDDNSEVVMCLASIAPNAERTDGKISPTLMARAGTGGGQLPIAVIKSYGLDSYNQEVCEEISMTMKTYMGGDNSLKVICLNDQGGSMMGVTEEITATIRAQEHGHQPIVYENHSQDSRYKELGDVSETMSAKYGTGGNNQRLVVSVQETEEVLPFVEEMPPPSVAVSQPNPITITHDLRSAKFSTDGISDPLTRTDYKEPLAVCVGNGQLNQMSMSEQSNTLDTMHDKQAVLTNKKADTNGGHMKSKVRRLTPEECEALQGFPRNWTTIGEPEVVEVTDYEREYDDLGNEISKTPVGSHKEVQYFYTDEEGRKRRCADSARYKALGNSIAVGYANNQSGFWMWLMKRISATYERSATLGSLFDGIGGFPLAWEFYNGKGSALWASEIESFPIQVTKERFKEE